MNKAVWFITGLAAGTGISWAILKNYYDERFEKDCQEMKNYYEQFYSDKKETIDIPEKKEPVEKVIRNDVRKDKKVEGFNEAVTKYSTLSKDSEIVDSKEGDKIYFPEDVANAEHPDDDEEDINPRASTIEEYAEVTPGFECLSLIFNTETKALYDASSEEEVDIDQTIGQDVYNRLLYLKDGTYAYAFNGGVSQKYEIVVESEDYDDGDYDDMD